MLFLGGGKKTKKTSKPSAKSVALSKTKVEDSPSVSSERKSKPKEERKPKAAEESDESADESDADTNENNDKSSGDESNTQKSNPEDDDQVSLIDESWKLFLDIFNSVVCLKIVESSHVMEYFCSFSVKK